MFHYKCGPLISFALEVTQGVLFMMITSYNSNAVIVLTMILLLHTVLIGIQFSKAEPLGDDASEKLMGFSENCQKLCQSLVVGLVTLPFLAYSSDSYFRSDWFDYILTVMLWGSATSMEMSSYALGEAMNESIDLGDATNLPSEAAQNWLYKDGPIFVRLVMWSTVFINIAYTFTMFVLCILYIPQASAGFEYGWTVFLRLRFSPPISFSFSFLPTLYF